MNGFLYPTKLKLVFFVIFFLAVFLVLYFVIMFVLPPCEEFGCLEPGEQSLRYSLYLLPVTLGLSYFLASLLYGYLKRIQS